MPRPIVIDCVTFNYLTSSEVCKSLGISRYQLNLRIKRKVFPEATFVDDNGVRYFSKAWLVKIRKMLDKKGATAGKVAP